MFCETCLKWGNPPAGSRRAWKTRGITDWNHGSELLKQHADSQWHRNAEATAVMARQAESEKSVLELQQAAEHRQRNRDVLQLLRSAYFLAKNRIPHTAVHLHLVNLQVANGDNLLEQHIKQSIKCSVHLQVQCDYAD